MLEQFRNGLAHLFYPAICEGCLKPLVGSEEILCIGCEAQLPETHFHTYSGNEAEQRLAGRIPFMHATAYAHFTDEGLLQLLLHGLKYRHRKDIGAYLGRLCARQLKNAAWIQDIDMVIPVPLHPKKEAARGYNQSMVIAAAMASELQKPIRDDILLRNRETESQTQKSRTERVSNMEGAFAIAAANNLKHKHILLCDDVLTTGATLEACALALMEEESIKISVVTIGIAAS